MFWGAANTPLLASGVLFSQQGRVTWEIADLWLGLTGDDN